MSPDALLAETERSLEGGSQWVASRIHRELGIDGVRGSLAVQSLDGAPLAAICRHTQTATREDVFQQPFDLRSPAQCFTCLTGLRELAFQFCGS